MLVYMYICAYTYTYWMGMTMNWAFQSGCEGMGDHVKDSDMHSYYFEWIIIHGKAKSTVPICSALAALHR